MSYIGKQPIVGNFVKLDAITTSATTTFNLLNGGVAYYPQSANNCIVSLNGVIQSPTTAYTISGSTIVFSDALTSSDTIDFILVLGDVLSIGTPSDNTVSLAKLTATGTKDSTTFLRGDNTFATAGATAGQVIQVVNAVDSTIRSTTSTTFVTASNTVSVNITPSSASNKILVFGFTLTRGVTGVANAITAVYRNNTTQLAITGSDQNGTMGATAFSYLDTPNTTSSTNYQIYLRATGGGGNTIYMNSSDGGTATVGTITAMEIKG